MERHTLTYLTTVVASLLAAMSLAVSDANAAPAPKQPADVIVVNPESMPVPTYDVDELPRDSRFSIGWHLDRTCVNSSDRLFCGTYDENGRIWQIPVGKRFNVTAIDATLRIPEDHVDKVHLRIVNFHTDEEVLDDFSGWLIYKPDYTCGAGFPVGTCAATWHLDVDLTWVGQKTFSIYLYAPLPEDPYFSRGGSVIRASGYLVDE